MSRNFTPAQRKFIESRKHQVLELNKTYKVTHRKYGMSASIVRLVKPTPKGFNLLVEATGKMATYPHMYPIKKNDKFNGYDKPMTFWVYKDWLFEPLETTEKLQKINEQRPTSC